MSEQADKVVACLNDAWERDPLAMRILLINVVPCSEALADHPTVIVQKFDEGYAVGPLGLLNGVLAALGIDPVAAKWSTEFDAEGRRAFVGFCPYQKPTTSGGDEE